jgi:hypothetical protein
MNYSRIIRWYGILFWGQASFHQPFFSISDHHPPHAGGAIDFCFVYFSLNI